MGNTNQEQRSLLVVPRNRYGVLKCVVQKSIFKELLQN